MEELKESYTSDKQDDKFKYTAINLLPTEEINIIPRKAPNDYYGLLSLEPYDNTVHQDVQNYLSKKLKRE